MLQNFLETYNPTKLSQEEAESLNNNNELLEIETKETVPFTVAPKKKKLPRNKFNQGCKRPVFGKL